MSGDGTLGLLNYWIVITLMMIGFYIVIAQRNLIKAVLGLNIFQTSVFLLYITMGKVRGGTAPIVVSNHSSEAHGTHQPHIDAPPHSPHNPIPVGEPLAASDHAVTTGDHAAELGDAPEVLTSVGDTVFSHPLPSVLMLTAIVVGIATTALALSLIVRIREAYGTIEEDEILAIEADVDRRNESASMTGAAA